MKTLADFLPNRYALFAVWDCGHMVAVDTSRLAGDLSVPVLYQ